MCSVGKSALFHQVASRRLAADGVALRVSLRPIEDHRLDQMRRHLEFLVTERRCDVVAFQIRPALLRQAAVVLWKDRRAGGWPRIRPCPYYREDLNDWTPPEGLSPVERLHRLNRLLARWTGLQDRARSQVVRQLRTLAEFAAHRLRRPLVLIGPVFNASISPPLADYWAPIVRHAAHACGTPLVDICDFRLTTTPERFELDGFHVNRTGHAIIGQRFAETLAGMLDSLENPMLTA